MLSLRFTPWCGFTGQIILFSTTTTLFVVIKISCRNWLTPWSFIFTCWTIILLSTTTDLFAWKHAGQLFCFQQQQLCSRRLKSCAVIDSHVKLDYFYSGSILDTIILLSTTTTLFVTHSTHTRFSQCSSDNERAKRSNQCHALNQSNPCSIKSMDVMLPIKFVTLILSDPRYQSSVQASH